MKTKVLLFLVPVLMGLFSCDDDDHELGKTVIDEIIHHENADQVGKYLYNRDGSVRRYESHFNNRFMEYTDYVYSQGNLITKDYYERGGDGNFTNFAHDAFSYNSNGQMINAILNEGGLTETIYELTWDGAHVSRIDYTFFSFGIPYHSFHTIEYDGRGNATTITYFHLEDEQEILSFILECEYDNKVNPLAELSEPYDYLLTNPNNIIKLTQRSSVGDAPYASHEIEYDYNESNMPVKKKEEIDLYGNISNMEVKFRYKKI